MVVWVVIDRRHYRQADPFALPLSTPLFPLLHLSPLLPYSYGHSYTTATHQPLCNQSFTHSFYLDGGCTPPAGSPLATAIPTQYPMPTSSSFFSHSCALFCTFLHFFCTHQKLNSLVFNRFRTLCEKPPGMGYPPSALPEVADMPQLFSWASGRSFLPKAGSIDRLLGCT